MSVHSKQIARKIAKQNWQEFLKNKSEIKKVQTNLYNFLDSINNVKRILVTVPLKDEIDVLSVVQKSKHTQIFIPQTKKNGAMIFRSLQLNSRNEVLLTKGAQGIPGSLESSPELKLPILESDLIIAPGLAINSKGYRLGRGGGYYDRFLATAKNTRIIMVLPTHVCNLEFKTHKHDFYPDLVITEKENLIFKNTL